MSLTEEVGLPLCNCRAQGVHVTPRAKISILPVREKSYIRIIDRTGNLCKLQQSILPKVESVAWWIGCWTCYSGHPGFKAFTLCLLPVGIFTTFC